MLRSSSGFGGWPRGMPSSAGPIICAPERAGRQGAWHPKTRFWQVSASAMQARPSTFLSAEVLRSPYAEFRGPVPAPTPGV